MNDQANRLRALARTQAPDATCSARRVMAIASGKGGVGKTNVVAGLAMALAQQGQRVVVLDADFGLANLDILLGLSPEYTLEHVLRGEKLHGGDPAGRPLRHPHHPGQQRHPGTHPAGRRRRDAPGPGPAAHLRQAIDWLLIDTAAGIHDSVIKLLMAAQEVLPGDHPRAHRPGGRLRHGQGGAPAGSPEAPVAAGEQRPERRRRPRRPSTSCRPPPGAS